jgi:hypothetical protein
MCTLRVACAVLIRTPGEDKVRGTDVTQILSEFLHQQEEVSLERMAARTVMSAVGAPVFIQVCVVRVLSEAV